MGRLRLFSFAWMLLLPPRLAYCRPPSNTRTFTHQQPRHHSLPRRRLAWVTTTTTQPARTTTTAAARRRSASTTNTPPQRLFGLPMMMISNLFQGGGGGSGSTKKNDLPRDVKQAVSLCRQATQDALQKRISRMDIEFPVGTKFGVEKDDKTKSGRRKQRSSRIENNADDDSAASSSADGAPTGAQLQKSDRELARLFVDMFQPVGGERISVAFSTVEQADAAKSKWKGDFTATCRILSMDRRASSSAGKKKKKKKARGFAAKLAVELDDSGSDQRSSGAPFRLPDDTEVAIFVAPGPRELPVIEKICNSVGMDTLVILLNARLSNIPTFGSEAATKLFSSEFEPVFSLAAAPQAAAPNCLRFRAFPGDWVLARKPKIGQPKTLLVQSTKPTEEECRDAFDQLELSDMERGVENAVENVANWFR